MLFYLYEVFIWDIYCLGLLSIGVDVNVVMLYNMVIYNEVYWGGKIFCLNVMFKILYWMLIKIIVI